MYVHSTLHTLMAVYFPHIFSKNFNLKKMVHNNSDLIGLNPY